MNAFTGGKSSRRRGAMIAFWREAKMRKAQIIILMAGLLFSLPANAEDKQTFKAMNRIEPLPKELEIQLALSALPPHLRDNATVYVLNPDKGFEVVRRGTNGFHTFVARTGDDTFRGCWPLTEYRNDILYPVSFDAAGAKAQMRVFFDAAEMQAKGTPPGQLKKIIKERFQMQYYKAPERGGVSYMVSPILRTYVNPDENDDVRTANLPHIMYYAPYVSNEDIGGKPPSIQFDGYRMIVRGFYPFVIMPGPYGYMIQFLDLKERAAINIEYGEMLARLCKIKDVWCLPKEKDQY
jgi:hypothetical protein